MFTSLFFFATSLWIGTEVLDVEIVKTPAAREKGLQGRSSLGENEGMLFVYPSEKKVSFWMLNTQIPLSVGFFDGEATLIEWLDMEVEKDPTSPVRHYTSKECVRYALEVPKGWFVRHSIEPGAKFSLHNRSNSVR